MLWARAYNKEDSFNMHCTGMVENINKQLKNHVSLKCSLVECIYRAIHFAQNLNKQDEITNEELLQFNFYFSLQSPKQNLSKPIFSNFLKNKGLLT